MPLESISTVLVMIERGKFRVTTARRVNHLSSEICLGEVTVSVAVECRVASRREREGRA
jgi:hypothetical protein